MSQQAEDVNALSKRVDAAGSLIRSGFTPEASLAAVGLDPIEHSGKEPVTVREVKE